MNILCLKCLRPEVLQFSDIFFAILNICLHIMRCFGSGHTPTRISYILYIAWNSVRYALSVPALCLTCHVSRAWSFTLLALFGQEQCFGAWILSYNKNLVPSRQRCWIAVCWKNDWSVRVTNSVERRLGEAAREWVTRGGGTSGRTC